MRRDDASHALIEQDVAAYALGGLDAAAATAVEDHLAECPACRELLREYQEVTRLLPLALPAAQPPADAREALLARAGGRRRGWRRGRIVAWLPRSLPGRVALASMAAVLALAIGYVVWAGLREDPPSNPADVVEQLQERDDVRIMAMTGSENAPGAVAQLIVAPDDDRAGLVASGLPILRRGQCYQLWFVREDGSRVSGGIFWEDDDGSAIALVELPGDLSEFRWLGVTEEPYPGSPAPTGPNVLRGEL